MSVRQGKNIISGRSTIGVNLLDYKWADHLLNDMSWLRADTFSWQSGDVYVAAYNHLAEEFKATSKKYYAWRGTEVMLTFYTERETPLAGDIVYTTGITENEWIEHGVLVSDYDGSGYLYFSSGRLEVIRSESEDFVQASGFSSDTIGDTTIKYYRAADGHKICLPDQEDKVLELYNKTGVAWYYILDTENKQFKLPRSKHNKYADTVAVVGNGKTLGLTDGVSTFGIAGSNNSLNSAGSFIARSGNDTLLNVGEQIAGWTGATANGKTIGVTTDSTKSGIIAQQEQDTDQYKYLYFYVGNFERDAVEQTAGLNAELFNQKMDNGTPLIRDIFSPEEWENESMEQILSAGVGSGNLVFTKNWQEFDYLWFSSVSDGSNALDDSPHWLNVKWMLSQAKAGVTNLAVSRYASGAYWYVNPQTWTETTMPVGSASESLFINRVYGIRLKNITAKNVGLLNYKGLFETASDLVATVPTAMGQWAIVSNDETQAGLQTKYFSTKDVDGNYVWAFGGIIDSSLTGADYVVESQLPTADHGYTWYRKYKSGWVEQGVRLTQSGSAMLPIEMSNNNYNLQVRLDYNSTGTIQGGFWYATKTTTGFTMGKFSAQLPIDWQVCGIAQ